MIRHFWCHVINVFFMYFRDYKGMSFCYLADIKKSQYMLVFIYFCTWNVSINDLAKMQSLTPCHSSLFFLYRITKRSKKENRTSELLWSLILLLQKKCWCFHLICLLNSLFTEIKNSYACYFCRKHLIWRFGSSYTYLYRTQKSRISEAKQKLRFLDEKPICHAVIAFNKHLIYVLVIKFISSTYIMMTSMPMFYSWVVYR